MSRILLLIYSEEDTRKAELLRQFFATHGLVVEVGVMKQGLVERGLDYHALSRRLPECSAVIFAWSAASAVWESARQLAAEAKERGKLVGVQIGSFRRGNRLAPSPIGHEDLVNLMHWRGSAESNPARR